VGIAIAVAALSTILLGAVGVDPSAGHITGTDRAGIMAETHRLATGSAGPSLAWANITGQSTHSPKPRESGEMIYDSTDGYVILFGGEKTGAPTVYYNDTWEFQAGHWTNLTSATAPSGRFGSQLADDPADHAVVLFGGRGPHAGEANLNDTWEFHAGVWTNVTHGVAPPGRYWGSMSYDNATSTVLLFGGSESPSQFYSNDTWSFHAGVWSPLSPARSPPARDDENQVDDTADHAVFLFGGLNQTDYLNDSWEYASNTWSRVSSAHAPDLRGGAGLAYDTATGDVVMYGGYPAPTSYFATWLFQGGDWSAQTLSPTPPSGTVWGQMAYDAHDGYVVLFEGDGDYNTTWNLSVSSGGGGSFSVSASVSPLTGELPLAVTFGANATGGTRPYLLSWEFGDANGSALPNTTHTYQRVGVFHVNLTVNDSAHHTYHQTWTVTVQNGSGGSPASSPLLTQPEEWGLLAAACLVAIALVFGLRRRRKPVNAPGPSTPGPTTGAGPPPQG